MTDGQRDHWWTPSGTLYDSSPLVKRPCTYMQMKAWRQQQHDHGKPSSADDFYRTHGICMGLPWRGKDHPRPRVAGTRIIGRIPYRW
jgi:hypothetical protein